MPQPTVGDVHVDGLLTMLLEAYMNMPEAFIADQIFPIVPVRKQSAIIPEYRKEDWFRDHAQLRAPGTQAQASGFAVVKDKTYYCNNYATAIEVPDEVRENQDSPFDVDRAATELVSTRLKLRREISFAADFMKTGVWDTDATLTNKWDDYSLSVPITDIEDGKEAVHSVTGREPVDLTIGRQVWVKLKHHPDLIERIKYTQRALLTTELVASLLELQRIMIGRAIQVTSTEADSTPTYAYIFGKSALLTWAPRRPSLMVPSCGYTFHWRNFGALSYVRRLREERPMIDVIEGHTWYDQKSVGTDLGWYVNAAVA